MTYQAMLIIEAVKKDITDKEALRASIDKQLENDKFLMDIERHSLIEQSKRLDAAITSMKSFVVDVCEGKTILQKEDANV